MYITDRDSRDSFLLIFFGSLTLCVCSVPVSFTSNPVSLLLVFARHTKRSPASFSHGLLLLTCFFFTTGWMDGGKEKTIWENQWFRRFCVFGTFLCGKGGRVWGITLSFVSFLQ